MGDGETLKRGAITPERWRRLKELFEAALAREPASRVAFLTQATADDPSLVGEVLRLLDSDEKADAFLSAPATPSFASIGSMSVEPNVDRPELFIGRVLSHYRLDQLLGVGGMGVVYRATDLKLGRAVALKLLSRQLAADDTAKARFLREARAASALDHPNIGVIHEVGEQDGELFIAMALYEGESLKERLDRGRLPLAEGLAVVQQLARGLEAAHLAGIVHRDIKPANVMLSSARRAKILDFGLAKSASEFAGLTITRAGQAFGTLLYMSPEQLEGGAADERSDLWSLGVVAYELFSGNCPFKAESNAATAARILNDEPPSLTNVAGMPSWLAKLISRLLRKNPSERPQTATEVLGSLDAGATGPMGRWSGARPMLIVLGIGVLAAAGLGWYLLSHGAARTLGRRDSQTIAAAPRSSIAVLPFVNISSDKQSEYFSDGITEELINALANVDELRVASRTSAFAFRGKNLSIQKIGEELKVATVVEGSVRRDGDRLRVTAQLVSAGDGYHIWSKTYEREAKNIFAMEDELARSIVEALRPKLIGSQSAPLVKPTTTSLEAHDLYLQGRYFKEKRTAEALRSAAGFFARAAEKDPQYALAWVGLADATTLRSEYDLVPASSVLPKAKQTVMRALELDPRLAEAHATLGLIATFSFQWAEAEAAYRKAIELNPKYPTVHHWYALLLGWQGRIPEAYAETDRAYRLDPTSPILNHLVGLIRLYARDFDGAIDAFKKTLEMVPNFQVSHGRLAVIYELQGKYTEALAEYDQDAPRNREFLGVTYVRAGRRSDAQRQLEEMEERAKREYVSPAARGVTWLALGEEERGYALLAQACADKDRALVGAKVEPLFDSFRADPRFHEVLKCVHLE